MNNWLMHYLFVLFICFTDTVMVLAIVIAVVIVLAFGAFGLLKLSLSVRLVLTIEFVWFMSDFAIA